MTDDIDEALSEAAKVELENLGPEHRPDNSDLPEDVPTGSPEEDA